MQESKFMYVPKVNITKKVCKRLDIEGWFGLSDGWGEGCMTPDTGFGDGNNANDYLPLSLAV